MMQHLGSQTTEANPIQVILATDSQDPSGVGHHMITLARHLGGAFRPVLAFAQSPAAPDFAARAHAAGLDAQIVGPDEWQTWIAARGADLLHVHAGIGWEGQGLVAAGRAAGLAVLRTEHLPWLITDAGQRQDYLAALRGVDTVITVSTSAAESWQAAFENAQVSVPIRAIPNGIAVPVPRSDRERVRQMLGLAVGERLILHVGRFTAQKAQDVLVRAFAILKEQQPETSLLMVGTGETRAAVEAYIADEKINGVLIEPHRPDMADVMAAADLVVLPSRFEGLPLVLLEAMAMGIPVVATRVPGIIDALGATHPFLVPPDDPAALAVAMQAALRDDGPADAGMLGARFERAFTADRMAATVAGTYRQALRRHRITQGAGQMQRTTRVGFVGAGGIAARHLGVLRDFDDVAVVAVADPDADRARGMAEGLGAQVYADPEAMIAGEDLDAVFICVPPFAHGPAERAAIAAGMPFFVEKPITLDLALAEEIADRVAKAGLVTAVGYHWRYLDTVDAARRALWDRQPQLIVGHWLDQTPPPAWWGKAAGSGGQIIEQVTHLIDTARFLAGGVRSVYAQGNHLARDRFADLDVRTAGAATLTFENGTVASLSATCLLNWNHRAGLHLFADGLAVELSDLEVMVDTGHGRHPRGAEGDPVWREDRDFIDAVRGLPNRIRTSYAEALETHRVAIAVELSMETGEVQRLVHPQAPIVPPVATLIQRPARAHEHRRIKSLGIEAVGRPYILSYDEGPAPEGEVRLDLCYTGFSAGTELTFMKGTNPYLHARWDAETGTFRADEPGLTYPVPFMGYMESARIIDSRAEGFMPGMVVGTTFGHKTGHTADPTRDLLVPLPQGMDPLLGVFVAQMGPIAANGILHADALCGGPETGFGAGVTGRRVAVWGGGTVGLLTALFAREAGAADVVIAEPSAFRRSVAERLGLLALDEDAAVDHAKSWGGPEGRGADLVFQTRARSESLSLALRALRPQGAVIDLAFYQGGMDGLRLGEEFHHNGLMMICAQIGRVPHRMADSWSRARLSGQTLRLLSDRGGAIRDAMITHVVPLDEGPAFLSHLVEARPEFLQIVFAHSA